MSNHAYISIWCKDFSELRILEQFGALLATVPFSASKPGFSNLVVRAVDATESPVLEQEVRAVRLDGSGVRGRGKDHVNDESGGGVGRDWDVWTYDEGVARWELEPEPL